MVPMMVPAAHGIADALQIETAGPARVLDIAASHGIFGITLAQRNPKVEVTAVDWAAVLGVAGRTRPRTASATAFTSSLATRSRWTSERTTTWRSSRTSCITSTTRRAPRFLPRCAGRSRRVDASSSWRWCPTRIASRRRYYAGFSLTMLGGTPAGDAYTLDELRDQLEKAGFADVTSHPLPTPETVVVARAI